MTRDNELVLDAWDFCEGWHPERLPMAAAYLGIADLAQLTAQCLLIRERIAARNRALKEAGGQP